MRASRTLVAFSIGQADRFYTTVGIMIAIALLAIAMLNNPTTLSPRKPDDAPESDANDPADGSMENPTTSSIDDLAESTVKK